MVRTLGAGEELPLAPGRIGVGLSWDLSPGSPIDLDLQAVAFDSRGGLLQAVYYNNLKAFGRGLTHSSDEQTGEKQGFDETVWVDASRLPQDVSLIVLVVSCYSGGKLSNVRNGRLTVLQDSAGNELGQMALERSEQDVDLVASLVRRGGSWSFHVIHEPARPGRHFIDILEPVIGNYVRRVIPGAPQRIKACFAMEKGSVVDLPKTADIKSIKAGLGWDTSQGEVDLDVSAVMLGEGGALVETVFFGNLEAPGVKHSGDNLTGQGRGDDEVINVMLQEVPARVQQIFFVINIYTTGKSFQQVSNPYCRVITGLGEEYCRYQLREAGSQSGLIVARLMRSPGDLRWSFNAIGRPCAGSMWKDSLLDVTKIANLPPSSLQRMETRSVGGLPGGGLPRASSIAPEESQCQMGCAVS